MQIAITGITGNMGQATLSQVIKNNNITKFKFLVLESDKRIKKILKKYKKDKDKFEIIYGNIADKSKCQQLVDGCDYVINLAAVIPPHSDKNPLKAIECNEVGVDTLVSVIEDIKDNQPKFIHISTMALYGNRNYKHPWARVGDPLLVSPFDIYAATKLRGEYRVLESSIDNWVVLRQTAMLHNNMLADNMDDGLMFHTCFNAPLEWITAHDSGVLIANIIINDQEKDLSNVFWKKCFNIAGGLHNCKIGYDILNDGFKIIGGTVKNFFKPNFNATRNFHGVWFFDNDNLNDLFNYKSQSVEDFWNIFNKEHSYLKIGKIVPKYILRKFAIEKLFKNPNSAKYWVKHDDQAKVIAYFGGLSNYFNIEKDWDSFNLLTNNKTDDGKNINYDDLKNIKNAKLINYYFDIDKDDKEIKLKDLQSVANAHGGKLLSQKYDGNIYKKLKWETQNNEVFEASVYTVLRAGHWFNPVYKSNCWDFDMLAKKDKIFAQIWYDSHDKNENIFYYFDDNFFAHYNKKD